MPLNSSPFVPRLTVYRMLTVSVILSLGTWKGIASFRNQSLTVNLLDVILGTVFGVMCNQ